MATRALLSASTRGRGILVAATATAGTLIHTTGISDTTIDEVWLYAYNSDTAPASLTVEFGGTSAPADHIRQAIPPQTGLTLVVPGHCLTGDGAAGLSIRAFAGTANVVVVTGYVMRGAPTEF